MSQKINEEYVAYIGIDWADQKHDVCLQESGVDKQEYSLLLQTPEAIDYWAIGLRKRFKGHSIAICLEQTKGALIYALLKYDFLVIYPVNRKADPASKFSEVSSNLCPLSRKRRSL